MEFMDYTIELLQDRKEQLTLLNFEEYNGEESIYTKFISEIDLTLKIIKGLQK